MCCRAILLSLAYKHTTEHSEPVSAFLRRSIFQPNKRTPLQQEKGVRAQSREVRGKTAGPSERENDLWCWRAQKVVSFRKNFLDHFTS